MNLQEEILIQLKQLNSNLLRLEEAFNKHTHVTGEGPTQPCRAISSKWEPKKFSAVQAELTEALNKEYSQKYAADDDKFFAGLGVDLLSMGRMQELAGLKVPKRTVEEVMKLPTDLPDEMFEDMLHSAVRNAGHVPPDQRMGYLAKGYGCKDPDKCITPSPHYVSDCRAKIANVKTPVPFMTAKEICETQPMMSAFYKEANREFFFSEKLARQIFDLEGIEGLRKKAPVTVNCDELVAMWFPPTPVDPGEFDDDTPTDPMIKVATPDLRAQRKKDGLCPECGDVKNESAVGICSLHGKFMG